MDVKKTLGKYDRKLAQDAKIAELNRKAREGMRKWQAAQELASRAGMTAAEVLLSDFLEEYPDGKIPEEAAKVLTVPVVKHNYDRVSEVAEAVQEAVNKEAGVGLKPVVPEFNRDRAEGLAKNISSWEHLAEHLGAVTKEIENNSMSIIDDTIRENAELHERVGLEPRVTRIYDGVGVHNRKHECKWCKERCGENMTYSEAYEKGAFQRHPGCGCELLYKTGKRVQRQADWTRNQWEEVENRDKIKARKEYGLTRANFKTAKMPPEEYARAKELWQKIDELVLPSAEKEHVYEELDNNLSVEEKESAIVIRAIGDHYYKAVNMGHNQYKIYGKEPIEPYTDWMDEILSEVVGPDWRKYDK